MMRMLFIAVIGFGAIGSANADDLKLSKDFGACMGKAEGERGAIAACYEKEFPTQDSRLNSAYKKIMSGLDAVQKTALRDAQRDWIKSRDSTCGLTVKLYHNSWMRYISKPWCKTEETARRAGFLEDMSRTDS